MKRFYLTVVLFVGLCAGQAHADFRACVEGLAAEAQAHGVSAQVAEAATRT